MPLGESHEIQAGELRLRSVIPAFKSQTVNQTLRLLSYLPRKRLKSLYVLLGLSFLLGCSDLLFVGLLARLVGVLSGSKLQDHLPKILVFGGGRTDQTLWIVSLLLVLAWASTFLKVSTALFQAALSAEIWGDYGNIMFSNVLLQDYEFFQGQRSSALLSRLNRVISRVSDDVLLPLLTIFSNALNVSVLAIGILWTIGPKALLLFASLFAAYAAISSLIIPRLRLASKSKIRFLSELNKVIVESLRSIRDIRLYSAEKFFIDKFIQVGVRGKRNDRLTKFLPEVPRYVIEPAAITLLFAIGLVPLLLQGHYKVVRDAFPSIAAIMFAALKLSSPIQQIFRSINKFRGGLPEIKDALDLIKLKPARTLRLIEEAPTAKGIMPVHTIKLDSVSFRYPNSERLVSDEIDLTIAVGSRVALVGRTGSGKTTAAHLLLGLLRPQSGQLLLDGIPLTESELAAWQNCCAIVPQNITLLDASIRANVAFAVDDANINDDKVWEALEAAQLDEFVSDLPYALYTIIGEDGLRLSGGQRQRLALARVLYKNAQFLVLDEATSALDAKTESHVMEAIELVGRRCTIVVIAHRLSTIQSCDRIYEFESGRIKATGAFSELEQTSSSFQEMVKLGRG